VEADLRRYYHVRLTDLWRGDLTLREIRVLLEHLPADSATAYSEAGVPRDNPLASWSLTDLLIGRLVDEAAAHRWQWESAHTKPGRQRKAPMSVLPDVKTRPHPPGEADVIPLVSPHQLGSFVHEQEGA